MNVLSVHGSNHVFTGKEINDWCRDQVNHGTARMREARRLLRKNYRDDRLYSPIWCDRNSGSGSGQMIVFRRKEG